MIAPLDVPGGYFEGHFPGRPILPAVAELALVARALDNRPVRAIPFARLRQVVSPGETLNLVRHEEGDDRVRFELTRGGALVANGTLVFGEAAPVEALLEPSASNVPSQVPPVDVLLPHRPPMQFVTAVLGETADGLACEARIPRACALVDEDAAPCFVALESAAQTAAVWEALRRSRGADAANGGPRIGYLVALRDVVMFSGFVPADTALIASIQLTALALPLTHYAVNVSLNGVLLLRGTIATFLAEEAAGG
jgi:predicted hotdog family 3-hydroxylacyl-ACP dehydratase